MKVTPVETEIVSASVGCDTGSRARLLEPLSETGPYGHGPQPYCGRVGNLPTWDARSVTGNPTTLIREDLSKRFFPDRVLTFSAVVPGSVPYTNTGILYKFLRRLSEGHLHLPDSESL